MTLDKETVRNLVEEAILTRKDSIGERITSQINGYVAFVDFDEKHLKITRTTRSFTKRIN